MVAHAPSHAADGAARAQITLTGRRAAMAGRVADTPRVRRHLPELQIDLAMQATAQRKHTTAAAIRGPQPAMGGPLRKPTTAFGQRLAGRSSMDVQATDLVLIPMAGPLKVIAAGGASLMAGRRGLLARPARTFGAAILASSLPASLRAREASTYLAADTEPRASKAARVLATYTPAEAVMAGTQVANIIADGQMPAYQA